MNYYPSDLAAAQREYKCESVVDQFVNANPEQTIGRLGLLKAFCAANGIPETYRRMTDSQSKMLIDYVNYLFGQP
jgi:hypothetical protein